MTIRTARLPARALLQAWRRLTAAPYFSLFSIATLALAIGLTAAVYSVLSYAISADIGARDPDALVSIRQHERTGARLSWSDYRDLEAQQQSFSGMAALSFLHASLGTDTWSTLAFGETVTGRYFSLVGASAVQGRLLTTADDASDAPPALVLSSSAYQRWFRDGAEVVGRVVQVNGQPYTVVGVVDRAFRGLTSALGPIEVSYWIPLAQSIGTGADLNRGSSSISGVVGRLRPGVTAAQASEDVRLIGRRLNLAYPLPPDANPVVHTRNWSVAPAIPKRSPGDSTATIVIIGLPLLVFLVACTNLANLALSRGIARRHTVAIRHALGASRARLIWEEMSEAVSLAVVGGVLGLVVARLMLDGVRTFVLINTTIPASSIPEDIALAPAAVVGVIAATFLSLIIGGLLPSLHLTRRGIADVIASDQRISLPGWRGRSNLIALQVSVSVGLFLIAFSGAKALTSSVFPPGPKLDGLAVAIVPFGHQAYDEPRARQVVDAVISEIKRTPGVPVAAAVAGLSGHDAALSIANSYRARSVTTPDRPFSDNSAGIAVSTLVGTPDMFDVLRLAPAAGRVLSPDDVAGSERVAVLNETLARELFGSSNAVDRALLVHTRFGGRFESEATVRIVGVVPNWQPGRAEQPTKELYLPYSQHYDANVTILAGRVGGDPPIAAVRNALTTVDPALATAFVGDGTVVGSTPAVIAGLIVAVGHALTTFALVLAMTGLYGVLSHVVSLRTRELAIRSALGASAGRIASMVLRNGLRPVMEGLLIGVGGALAIRQILRATVAKDLSAIDPLAFALVMLLLVTAGVGACYLPARRASRVDPNVALRE